MRGRDADQPGRRLDHLSNPFRGKREPVLEPEVDEGNVAPDCARGLQIGRIIRPHDDEIVLFPEQRGRDDEQGARRAAGDQDVVSAQGRVVRSYQRAQFGAALMLAVKQDEAVGNQEAEVGERLVRY